jgi:histidine triad (HIT) family protein
MTTIDCLFRRIARGESEASRVYEDERAVCFMDIQPVTPGHILVEPRRHAAYLADLDAEKGSALFRIGQTAAALGSSLRLDRERGYPL